MIKNVEVILTWDRLHEWVFSDPVNSHENKVNFPNF